MGFCIFLRSGNYLQTFISWTASTCVSSLNLRSIFEGSITLNAFLHFASIVYIFFLKVNGKTIFAIPAFMLLPLFPYSALRNPHISITT
ncbi:hypothetical protein BC943DRAFT_324236 [Umbelopsis sp. AD052]|nr:hypothetical protein BC943DRAFT_324236 [Umbelopsis sp. AD052]